MKLIFSIKNDINKVIKNIFKKQYKIINNLL